jgi:hypothetical protein
MDDETRFKQLSTLICNITDLLGAQVHARPEDTGTDALLVKLIARAEKLVSE